MSKFITKVAGARTTGYRKSRVIKIIIAKTKTHKNRKPSCHVAYIPQGMNSFRHIDSSIIAAITHEASA